MMTNLFEKLYAGQLRPKDMACYDHIYKDLQEGYLQNRERLAQRLCPEDAEDLKRLLNAHTDVLNYEVEEHFQIGFCVGMAMMMDVMQVMRTHFSFE